MRAGFGGLPSVPGCLGWLVACALVIAAACVALSGCTAADQQKAHGAFVDVLGVLKWACRGVGAVDSVHTAVTSGGDDGEEPRTIDEVP